jgi:hypothetical protein
MTDFKEFGIKLARKNFIGDQIQIKKVLNKEIIVHDFKIVDSTKVEGSKCLHLQLSVGGTKYVLFSGSKYLIEGIQLVPAERFPFTTTIIEEEDGSFEFS